VKDKLKDLLDAQYKLTYREEIQIRTRTEERTGHRTVKDLETGETSREEYTYEVEVEYEYRILHVRLVNNTMEACIDQSSLTQVQKERYLLLNQTRGNRDYLFGDDVYANPSTGEYTDYDIPTEALSDAKFANMMQEAEKYLGYPYVWGGSSPSTSFDCSGFVCWVINHCGNGWNVGRTTAEGLRQQLNIIPASEAKPGDIIFFQGTYDTPGASHVGIYVGNGMMIHCGNPIQYASVNSSYFRQHFYCYGRLN
jgi:cell wall-associated NlpC family hydrolase